MGLDARVRCNCVQEGKAKPHPFPDRLRLDETGEPILTGDPSDDDLETHEAWFAKSCAHDGYVASESLGNVTSVKHLREFLRGLQGDPGPKFPLLLEKVLYNGTHTGDWIPTADSEALLREVQVVLQSSDILSEGEKAFFNSMERLCQASLATGNPIVF